MLRGVTFVLFPALFKLGPEYVVMFSFGWTVVGVDVVWLPGGELDVDGPRTVSNFGPGSSFTCKN
jgi:hypothetical protein